MKLKLPVIALFCLLASYQGLSTAEEPAKVPDKDAAPPAVEGEWSGIWGAFNPTGGGGLDKAKCKGLDCKVIRTLTGWEATFEGECGRPYKYTITMDGRQSAGSVLFRGTADLGEEDGGIHDWVGRANNDEFIGFYTSAHHTGAFTMSRRK